MNRKEKFEFTHDLVWGHSWNYFDVRNAVTFIETLETVPEDVLSKEFVQLGKAYSTFINHIFEFEAEEAICPELGQIVKVYKNVVAFQSGVLHGSSYKSNETEEVELDDYSNAASPLVRVKPWTPKDKKLVKKLEELLKQEQYTKTVGELNAREEAKRIKQQARKNLTTLQTYRAVWPLYYQLKGIKVPGNATWIHSWKMYRETSKKEDEARDNEQYEIRKFFEKAKETWMNEVKAVQCERDNYYPCSHLALAVIIPGLEKDFRATMNELVAAVRKTWPKKSITDILRRVVDNDCSSNYFDNRFFNCTPEEKKAEIIKDNEEKKRLVEACRSMICCFNQKNVTDYFEGIDRSIEPTVPEVLKKIGAYSDEDIAEAKKESA